jgi:transposase-like protein
MSRMTDEEYAKGWGLKCPYCGSDNLRTLGKLEGDCDCAWQEVACSDCESEWVDHFKLVGYSEVENA